MSTSTRAAGLTATNDRELDTASQLLLTVDQAARRLGVGRSLMYELLTAGEVGSIHVGRLRKVPARALEEYVERRLSEPDHSVGVHSQ